MKYTFCSPLKHVVIQVDSTSGGPRQLQQQPQQQLVPSVTVARSCSSGSAAAAASKSSSGRTDQDCFSWKFLCGPNPKKAIMGTLLFLAIWASLSIGFNLLKEVPLYRSGTCIGTTRFSRYGHPVFSLFDALPSNPKIRARTLVCICDIKANF